MIGPEMMQKFAIEMVSQSHYICVCHSAHLQAFFILIHLHHNWPWLITWGMRNLRMHPTAGNGSCCVAPRDSCAPLPSPRGKATAGATTWQAQRTPHFGGKSLLTQRAIKSPSFKLKPKTIVWVTDVPGVFWGVGGSIRFLFTPCPLPESTIDIIDVIPHPFP